MVHENCVKCGKMSPYVPWCNDWQCSKCKTCNIGKNKVCSLCKTPMPANVWINLKSPKQETCKCEIINHGRVRKYPNMDEWDEDTKRILSALKPVTFPKSLR